MPSFKNTLLFCLALSLPFAASADSLDMKLRKELPLGSSAEEVEKVLTQERIEHHFYKKKNIFKALYRVDNPSNGPLAQEGMAIVIYLDEQQQVRNIETKRVFGGR